MPNKYRCNACAVQTVSVAVKAPCWNRTWITGTASTQRATVAGMSSTSTNRKPRPKMPRKASQSPAEARCESEGSEASETATGTSPNGIWIKVVA